MTIFAKAFDVIIAGAGPAGSSAAIHLAMTGARVLLIEEKKFPRAKLCGEFISPECFTYFKRLGVMDQMISAGGASLSETVFYSRRGHSVAVPSAWFKFGTTALGLSRREMDRRLLERAKSVGVEVLEKVHASGLILESGRVVGVCMKAGDVARNYEALVTIDATGRACALARHLDKNGSLRTTRKKPRLVAFKTHLENARVAHGSCEIYFYPRGYGGLSGVEGGLSNLCFIVSADDVCQHGSDPETVMREVVMKNERAAYALAEARARTPWLSVSLVGFGRRRPSPAPGLLAIGDAAAFIDPFTGSGMLMALESGQVAAEVILRHLDHLRQDEPLEVLANDALGNDYRDSYAQKFYSRLHISGLLRRAAFVPYLAEAAIFLCGTSSRLRCKLARATRHSTSREVSASTS
jgi:flavin-dependent dehydrogenase